MPPVHRKLASAQIVDLSTPPSSTAKGLADLLISMTVTGSSNLVTDSTVIESISALGEGSVFIDKGNSNALTEVPPTYTVGDCLTLAQVTVQQTKTKGFIQNVSGTYSFNTTTAAGTIATAVDDAAAANVAAPNTPAVGKVYAKGPATGPFKIVVRAA